MKVLLIDDDRYLTDAICEIFEIEGIDVTTINRAEDFISKQDIVADHDCVILDIMMRCPPEFEDVNAEETGYLLLKKIREKDIHKPVLVISGKDKNELKIPFKEGLVDFLPKPLNARYSELVEKVKGYIR